MPVRILLFLAVSALLSPAAYLVGDVGDDIAFNNYMKGLGFAGYQNLPTVDYSQEIFSAQAKFGSNAAGGNNELGLHWNYAPASTPPTNDTPISANSSSPIITTFTGSRAPTVWASLWSSFEAGLT
jgi:hypothetical protein